MTLIEIFKAGKRPDANGVEVEITTDDLQQAVNAYNVNFHESPAELDTRNTMRLPMAG